MISFHIMSCCSCCEPGTLRHGMSFPCFMTAMTAMMAMTAMTAFARTEAPLQKGEALRSSKFQVLPRGDATQGRKCHRQLGVHHVLNTSCRNMSKKISKHVEMLKDQLIRNQCLSKTEHLQAVRFLLHTIEIY